MRKITKEEQDLFQFTDAQVDNLEEHQVRLIKTGFDNLNKYQIVAEVVESKHCTWGAKVGDKIVMNGAGHLIPAKCSNPEKLCMWAVAKLLPFSYMFYDRACSGLDPTGMLFKRIKCEDPGVDDGGWGQIVMEVRAELVKP
jgi:uncharacterized repeat protein (TIGR04076 family)